MECTSLVRAGAHMNQHDKNQLIVLAVILVCASALMHPIVCLLLEFFGIMRDAIELLK